MHEHIGDRGVPQHGLESDCAHAIHVHVDEDVVMRLFARLDGRWNRRKVGVIAEERRDEVLHFVTVRCDIGGEHGLEMTMTLFPVGFNDGGPLEQNAFIH